MKKIDRFPYIKPTRYKHDSGFRTFEVGYILKMTDDNKVAEKEVLGSSSDHIYQDYGMLITNQKSFCINLDLTVDGYIRFFSHNDELEWESPYSLSSMGLRVKESLI
jgi:hypothetical protein